MKNLANVVVAMALTLLTNASFAAITPVGGHQALASTVMTDTASPALINLHWEKLSADNNHRYPMTSVSGQHNMHKTSVVYE